jgi:hypothetical protein
MASAPAIGGVIAQVVSIRWCFGTGVHSIRLGGAVVVVAHYARSVVTSPVAAQRDADVRVAIARVCGRYGIAHGREYAWDHGDRSMLSGVGRVVRVFTSCRNQAAGCGAR